MTVGTPDAERRLVPRWRGSAEAVKAGELRSPKNQASVPPQLHVPEFLQILDDWNRLKTIENAADVLSSAVALGRHKDHAVNEAANFLVKHQVSKDLFDVASKVLSGSLGGSEKSEETIGFDKNFEMHLRSRIATHKRSVRAYPKNAVAWADLARLYTALGQSSSAKSAIQVAINLARESRFVLRSAARFFVHFSGKNSEGHIDEGLHLLRRSKSLKADPWIMAAEISLSTILDETPASLKWARALAEKDALDPWHLSELNGSLATLALMQGGIGKPGKLFKKSLRSPTENALAQAQWAGDKHNVIQVPKEDLERPGLEAFEALALKEKSAGRWRSVLKHCRNWAAMEPTSTRPLSMGTYVAEAILGDPRTALPFAERAVLLDPANPFAHNNLAVVLADLGELDTAEDHASRFPAGILSNYANTVHIATQGLISYRRGDRTNGLRLYISAARSDAASDDPAFRARIMWHLLREEGRVQPIESQELVDALWDRTKLLKIPELSDLRERVTELSKTNAFPSLSANKKPGPDPHLIQRELKEEIAKLF